MNKKFTIECEMDEVWVDVFLSFLKHLESRGEVDQCAEPVLFVPSGYANQKGEKANNFKPKFNTDQEFTVLKADSYYDEGSFDSFEIPNRYGY